LIRHDDNTDRKKKEKLDMLCTWILVHFLCETTWNASISCEHGSQSCHVTEGSADWWGLFTDEKVPSKARYHFIFSPAQKTFTLFDSYFNLLYGTVYF
jgi:hypothetical protein